MRATLHRARADGRALWTGRARLVTGARFLLFLATALWVPVLLIPGDTTRGSTAYALIQFAAARLGLPAVDGVLAPGELLLLGAAAALCGYSAWDYACGGGRRAGLRVYLASLFWVALATSYLLSNPRAYGTWLFVGFAALAMWCVRAMRGEEGAGGG